MSDQTWVDDNRFGRPMRHFPISLCADALALAWARQEAAEHGSTVVVDREISPRGRHGHLWDRPAEQTLACAVVVRPALPADQADVLWLAAGLAAMAGSEAAGTTCRTWWPDAVVDSHSEATVAVGKAEIQLGPGQVRSAVLTVRLDLGSRGVAASADVRDNALRAVVDTVDRLCEEGPVAIAAEYDGRCAQLGRRVKLTLLPKGETRGMAARVTTRGELELTSSTGMIERVPVDALRNLTVV